MHLTGFTVCVNYSDFLAKGLPFWRKGFESLCVITDTKDSYTERLCSLYECRIHKTDIFYADGAKFNKGRAIAEAFDAFELECSLDWVSLFDADIIPPTNWREEIERSNILPGNLYGSWRYDERGVRIKDGWMAGWFFLAHISDPNMQIRPIVDIHWNNAGVYDSHFQQRWPREKNLYLDLKLVHQGDTGRNWCGRGNDLEMARLLAERRKKRTYDQERLEIP